MPTTLQFRRGTASQNNAFTGSVGELSIDTESDTIRVHDGSTAGGFTLTQNAATQTLTNKTLTSPQINTQIDMLARAEMRFQDASGGQYVALEAPATISSSFTFVLPDADGSSGQALVTDGSGNLSFSAAGATISSDTSTNTDFLVYFASTTSGALTAVKQDSGLTYNPSTGTLTSAIFSGTATTARYADLAEKYIADKDYEAGTVLVFGGEQEVTECTKKYNKRIAGIVSTDPAYLMNSDSEGVAVGLLGRVPCKVIGEIRKGDLMVASDTAGHAEAWKDESNPPMGSVIGKALEDKHGASTSIIEVVVGKI